jgi:hypothetical protein
MSTGLVFLQGAARVVRKERRCTIAIEQVRREFQFIELKEKSVLMRSLRASLFRPCLHYPLFQNELTRMPGLLAWIRRCICVRWAEMAA